MEKSLLPESAAAKWRIQFWPRVNGRLTERWLQQAITGSPTPRSRRTGGVMFPVDVDGQEDARWVESTREGLIHTQIF